MVLKILALGGLQFIYLLIYLFIYLFIYFWVGGLILTACHEPTVIVVWKSVLLP